MVSLWGSVENLNLSDHLINKFSKVEIYIYNKVHPASTQEQGCWIPKLSYERRTFLQFVLIMITLSVIDLTITLTMNNIFWGKYRISIVTAKLYNISSLKWRNMFTAAYVITWIPFPICPPPPTPWKKCAL